MIYTTLSLVVLLISYVWVFSPLGTSDRVGITMAISTVALVIVTSIYAWHTRKMAEEVREQRYDAVRPIIDIERRLTELERAGVEMNIVNKRELFPDKLTCKLRNIGVGPATDVYSFVQPGTQPDDNCPPLAYGTVAQNGEMDECPLSLKPRDNRKVLVVYYRDVYGQCFESSREVNRSDWKLGALETRKIAKEEFPK